MNEHATDHPERDVLVDFGLGRLDPSESSWIEDHLSECRDCCNTLLNLTDDTFTGLVRSLPEPVEGSLPDSAPSENADGAEIQCEPHSSPNCGEVTVGGVTDHDSIHAVTMLVQSGESVAPAELPTELQDHPRYRIVELIGKGGMGDVYRAEHRLMNRSVALKLINSQLIKHPQAVERFQREVQAAAQLTHSNIVTAFDAEQAGDVHFLVMEFVDGIDLTSVVQQRGRLPVDKACDFIRQAALGLQHAHEKGMVHRDVKPHNLMLSSDDQIRILDFGLAGFATESALMEADSAGSSDADTTPLHLTTFGSVMGTPDYIAPEQARDAHTADIRADIYSLGCTLYYLLSGGPPFQAESVVEKLTAHAEWEPQAIELIRVDVPEDLADVIRRMMAKDPAERFQSPAQVADALAPFVDRHRTNDGGRGAANDILQNAIPDPLRFAHRDFLASGALTIVAAILAISNRGWITFQYPEWCAPWLTIGGMVSLPIGLFILCGAIALKRLKSYAMVLSAGTLSLIPLNPAAVAMLPLNAWLLSLLRSREIRSAFQPDGLTSLSTFAIHSRKPRKLCLACSSLIGTGLLGVIIHFGTDHGQLIIEVDDPSLTVRIARNGREMRLLQDGETRVTFLPSGEYDITIPDAQGEVSITPTQVRIFRGAYKFVTIHSITPDAARITAKNDQPSDAERIQGAWVAESGQRGGQALPSEQIGMQRAVFEADRLTVTMPEGFTGEGIFELRTAKQPREIWIQVKGRSDGMRGIYRLERDRLTLCMNQDRTGGLPAKFESPTGTSVDLIILRRESSRGKPPAELSATGQSKGHTNPRSDAQAPPTPFEELLSRQNKQVIGNSLPLIVFARNGQAAFRFAKWLLVFEGVPCKTDPKTSGLLGIGGFNYPIRGGRGTVGGTTFGKQVTYRAKWNSQANEITVDEKYTFKLLGRGKRLEFSDGTYVANDEVQTVVIAPNGSSRLENPSRSPAVLSAIDWLSFIDEEKYAQAWDACGTIAKSQQSKDEAISRYTRDVKPLGGAVSRTPRSQTFGGTIPGARLGDLIVVRFETTFAQAGRGIELVTLHLEKDGLWRVAAYEAVASAAADRPTVSRNDYDCLQGTWICIDGVRGNKPLSRIEAASMQLTFDHDQVEIAVPDGTVVKVTFALNQFRNPKWIEFKNPDQTRGENAIAGLYAINDDTLRITFDDADRPRPRDFKPTDNSDHFAGSFRRATPNDVIRQATPEESQTQKPIVPNRPPAASNR